MAEARIVMSRAALDAELDRLAGMLPRWREKLRDEAQFWPQFHALRDGIAARAEAADQVHLQLRIRDMLAENGIPPESASMR